MTNYQAEYDLLARRLTEDGVNVAAVEARLKQQQVETPSWGYADSGTRFGVFRMAGAPRNVFEKFEDAAQAHKFTGIAPSVAVHLPWDTASNWKELSDYAHAQGVSVGAVNPNVFQGFDYRFGSLGSARPAVRARAVAHLRECVEIMNIVGSRNLSLWFADGTNFPGQGHLRNRKHWFAEGLDVRPLLWKVRSDLNLPDPADPVRGFVDSGYAQAKADERGTGGGAGLGA